MPWPRQPIEEVVYCGLQIQRVSLWPSYLPVAERGNRSFLFKTPQCFALWRKFLKQVSHLPCSSLLNWFKIRQHGDSKWWYIRHVKTNCLRLHLNAIPDKKYNNVKWWMIPLAWLTLTSKHHITMGNICDFFKSVNYTLLKLKEMEGRRE